MTQLVVVSAGASEHSQADRLAEVLGDAVRRATDTRDRSIGGGAEGDDVTRSSGGAAPSLTQLRLADHHVAIGAGLLDCVPRPELAAALETVTSADVLVAVTPVHNASYSALFKAFFDQVPRGGLAGVPTIMGVAGGSERHGLVLDLVLRPYLATLRALVVPTAVDVHRRDWLPHGMPRAEVQARIDQAAAEAVSLATARGVAPPQLAAPLSGPPASSPRHTG